MSDLIITNISGEHYIKLSAFVKGQIDPVLMVPYNDNPVPVKLRQLRHVEIKDCGDFSLIETMRDKIISKRKKITPEQMVNYSELQHNILKKAMVSPTYEELMKLNEFDVLRIESEKGIKAIKDQLGLLKASPKKRDLTNELNQRIMDTQYWLPPDFVSYIMSYSLRIDDTDIKLVSEDMLYSAAIKAKNGNDNPADHIHGVFTDFNREDINERSWIVYYKRQKEAKGK
jgi:hypothetical protein